MFPIYLAAFLFAGALFCVLSWFWFSPGQVKILALGFLFSTGGSIALWLSGNLESMKLARDASLEILQLWFLAGGGAGVFMLMRQSKNEVISEALGLPFAMSFGLLLLVGATGSAISLFLWFFPRP